MREERSIPFNIYIATAFSGYLMQFAWLTFGFTFNAAMVFIPHIDFVDSSEYTSETQGVIVGVEDSGGSENYDSDCTLGTSRKYAQKGRVVIFSYTFAFLVDGKKYNSKSYSQHIFNPGQSVRVEFSSANPTISRIKGMRRAPFPLSTIYCVLLPFFFFVLICYALYLRRSFISLMKFGIITKGELARRESTGETAEKGYPIYDLIFSYTTSDGVARECKMRTSKFQLYPTYKKYKVIYDPQDKDHAKMTLDFPGYYRFLNEEDLQGSYFNYLALVIPMTAIFGNIYLYLYPVF
jgi:hypothetical protein